jgi:hypothetical protein
MVIGQMYSGGLSSATVSDMRSAAARPISESTSASRIPRISFGAAEGYTANGGLPVIADDCPASRCVDVALGGIRLVDDRQANNRATAAFVAGIDTSVRVRLWLEGSGAGVWVRATGRNAMQPIRETFVRLGTDGTAIADLTIADISWDHVQVIDDVWTFELRSVAADREDETIATPAAEVARISVPIRAYVTAGRPINAVPRESFYYAACAVAGARTRREAQQNIWSYFASFHHGSFVTNARGQRMMFWRDHTPGAVDQAYLDRPAQGLVTACDSSCYGWADLLKEAMEIHGIKASVKAILPDPSRLAQLAKVPLFMVPNGRGGTQPLQMLGLLVRSFRWSATDAVHPPSANEPGWSVNVGDFRWTVNGPKDQWCVQWAQPDAADVGRATQPRGSNGQPVSGFFSNHAAVMVESSDGTQTWYDPTFGLGPHSSLESYERDLLGKDTPTRGGLYALTACRVQMTPGVNGTPDQVGLSAIAFGAMPAPDAPVLAAVEPGPVTAARKA